MVLVDVVNRVSVSDLGLTGVVKREDHSQVPTRSSVKRELIHVQVREVIRPSLVGVQHRSTCTTEEGNLVFISVSGDGGGLGIRAVTLKVVSGLL